MPELKVFPDQAFKRVSQPISGFTLGYEPYAVYRFSVSFTKDWTLVSKKSYKSMESARAAGKRFMTAINP